MPKQIIRKPFLKTSLTVLFLAGLFFTGFLGFSTAQNTTTVRVIGETPSISSVSPITAAQSQTITILGSDFGNVAPQTMSLGDGSVDTIDGNTTPSIQIRDNSLIDGWTAGYENGYSINGIGIVLVSWSDNKVVLGGFGTALSTTGQGRWNIMPGDPIQIMLKVSGETAVYTTTAVGSQGNTNQNSGALTISSVSNISANCNQTIVIKGTGFGNTQPYTISLGDGSVNTLGGGSTPVIQVHDDGWCGWEAGTQDGPNTGADLIGVILVSWSDTQIVLDGFGSALVTNGQYRIVDGDPIRVVVITPAGEATYETKVGASGTPINPIDTPSPASSTPQLEVSCQSSTTLLNFRVEIKGNLTTNNGVGIPDSPIALYYSIDQGSNWVGLTSVDTDSDGNFLAEWLPTATGNYVVNATYAGNSTYPGTSTIVNLVVTPCTTTQNSQNVFSVMSNSTVTDLVFNSTTGQLSFTVKGPSGSTGYADIFIAKALVNDTSTVKAYIDGEGVGYTVSSNGDSWILHFSYHHSTHQITIDLNVTPVKALLSISQLLQGVIYGAIVTSVVIVVLLLVVWKRQK